MKYITASEIIELLKKQNINDAIGQIKMSLNGTEVVIKQNDIIGNALQEWLGQFLKENDIYFRSAKGQTFPDFYLSESDEKNLCEMKTYYATRNAAFDVANYFGYVDSIRQKPWRLDSDYLIFAYLSDDQGNISIQDPYLVIGILYIYLGLEKMLRYLFFVFIEKYEMRAYKNE